jgi:phage shock protein C
MAQQKRTLYRLPKQGKVAGVCAGLSDYFDFDVTVMRLLWVIAVFATGGMMILVYIVLAIVLPVSDGVKTVHETQSDTVGEDMKQRVNRLGQDLRDNQVVNRARNYMGLGFIAVGIWLLLAEFMPEWFNVRWSYIWPLILIIFGAAIVFRGGRYEEK